MVKTVKDLLASVPRAFAQEHAYIFDHAIESRDTMTSYKWSVHHNDTIVAGVPVLNRRPSKVTKTHKFEIFGGGFIESISEPDAGGDRTAKISHPFEFVKPMVQGDPDLEAFQWTSKKKKTGTWENFWNQYGLNRISMQDFLRLVEGRECIPVVEGHAVLPQIEDDTDIVDQINSNDDHNDSFQVCFDNGTGISSYKSKRCHGNRIGRHIDFRSLQKERDKVGALGEMIVYQSLKDEAEAQGKKVPVHISKIEGDGLGYDIRAWDDDGRELHIEVKTTKSNHVDGFEMSRNEVELAREDGENYLIYRVYNLDVAKKTCDIHIYEGPFADEEYHLEPTNYKIYMLPAIKK